MLIPIFDIELMRKLSLLIFLLCVWISLKNQNAEPKKGISTARWSSSVDSSLVFSASPLPQPMVLSSKKDVLEFNDSGSLKYNFYRNSCPQAEQIVRSVVQRLHEARPDVVPALLRLVFHDCFIEVSFSCAFLLFFIRVALKHLLMVINSGFFVFFLICTSLNSIYVKPCSFL